MLPGIARLPLAAGAGFNIRPSTEMLAGAGQHRDPYVLPVTDRVEDQHHLFLQCLTHRVHRRIVHGHNGNVILNGTLDGFRIHRGTLPSLPRS